MNYQMDDLTRACATLVKADPAAKLNILLHGDPKASKDQ